MLESTLLIKVPGYVEALQYLHTISETFMQAGTDELATPSFVLQQITISSDQPPPAIAYA